MKTIIFLVSSFLFIVTSYQIERNDTWDTLILLIAPIVGISVLKLCNIKIIEAQNVEVKWFKIACLLGVVYAFLKLFIKLTVFNHQLATYSVGLDKLIENIFMIIVFMPILEEFFFRGILFDDLKKIFGTTFTISITSVAFVALHIKNFSDDEVFGSVIAMLPGIIFYNYLKVKTNNFLLSYVAHVTHNIIVFSFVTTIFRNIE